MYGNKHAAKGTLRLQVINDSLKAVSNSKLILFLLIIVIESLLLFNGIISMRWYLAPIIFVYFLWKQLVFEFFLVMHSIDAKIGRYDWYTKVDTGLFLGGIPLQSMEHGDLLTNKLKITALLSVVEKWEMSCDTVVGKAVEVSTLKPSLVSHLLLETPDFIPPPISILDDGAKYINIHVSEGRNVYCHCKSGIGRSATVVAAYLVKYKKLSAVEAWSELKLQRPVIFGNGSSQYQRLLEYERFVRGNK